MNFLRSRYWMSCVLFVAYAQLAVAQENPVSPTDTPSVAIETIAEADSSNELKFDFGSGPLARGWTRVDSENRLDDQSDFGFDCSTHPTSVDRESGDPLTRDFMTGDAPFCFSVKLPEGNYRVTMTLGDAHAASFNTVKSESRRLMLESVDTQPGQFVTRSFMANIRTTAIQGSRNVGLKKREIGVLHWDDKLTIEFNGSRPAVCSLTIAPAPDVPTLFLLGDSTVADQPSEPWNSWGQMLTRFFGADIAIANHAASGESIRSSLGARRVRKVLQLIRPGDYLFVQYGHNDMKIKTPNALANYKSNLCQLVDDVRSRGAKPILVTSMERKSGVEKPTLEDYPQTVRDIAIEEDVPLIDLNRMSLILYRAMGKHRGRLFQDGTHHNSYGSYQIAQCVLQGIRDNVPELTKYLRADAPTFDPGQPDQFETWNVPPSPNFDSNKPDGS